MARQSSTAAGAKGKPSTQVAPKRSARALRILEIKPAGTEHQVVSVSPTRTLYRRQPCSDCPWRVDATGEFPPEAFAHSAVTARDMSQHAFACHQSGVEKSALCAGFLLRGADDNMVVRLAYMRGDLKPDFTDGGVELHEGYTAMAIANGVDPDDPCLKGLRN